MIEVRPATPADADGVADAHIASWRVGYRGVVPDSYLDSPGFAETRRAQWQAEDWRTRMPDGELWVATLDGVIVGLSVFGPERVPVGEPATGWGEVAVFYLHPDAWGTGAAAALMDAATRRLAERGYREAMLWVLRDNPRARAFYAKVGWTPTDQEDHFTVDGVPLVDVRYERRL